MTTRERGEARLNAAAFGSQPQRKSGERYSQATIPRILLQHAASIFPNRFGSYAPRKFEHMNMTTTAKAEGIERQLARTIFRTIQRH